MLHVSIQVSEAVWRCGPRSRNQRSLLLAIADHADVAGFAYPSIAGLAEKCVMTPRNVLRLVRLLVEAGWMEVTQHPRNYRANAYQINLPKLSISDDNLSHEPEISGDISGISDDNLSPQNGVSDDNLSHENGISGDISGTSQVTFLVSPLIDLTVIEPSVEQTTTTAKTTTPPTPISKKPAFVLPERIDATAWAAFEEMRKTIRKPLTDDARRLAVGRLDKFAAEGMTATAVLNQSTLQCWAGVFPIKPDFNHGGNGNGNGNGTGTVAAGRYDKSVATAQNGLRAIARLEDNYRRTHPTRDVSEHRGNGVVLDGVLGEVGPGVPARRPRLPAKAGGDEARGMGTGDAGSGHNPRNSPPAHDGHDRPDNSSPPWRWE
jgi:hypothetical protein